MASELQRDVELDVTSGLQTPEPKVATPASEVLKRYPPRGQWTLHRLASAVEFLCLQCYKQKKAKLIATRHKQWDDLCCNACYGQILSKIKADND
ncbi:hypothetical protein IQ07DRAFT_650754 [Pyrenochaeta sp. DS3sAY3a]|nr:hypothetical protein IQ07DRAFT_650754 [Pyrenochaeta sp. DS3sAY3a]